MQYSLVKRVFPKWKEALENTEPIQEPEKTNVELVQSILPQQTPQFLEVSSQQLPNSPLEDSMCSMYITHIMSCETCKSKLNIQTTESESFFDKILPYLIIVFLLLVVFNVSD